MTADQPLPSDDRVSIESYRLLFSKAPVPAAVFDFDGRYLAVNDEYCLMVGRRAADLLRTGFGQVTHDDDVEATTRVLAALEDGTLLEARAEKRYVRESGREIIVAVHYVAVTQTDGSRVVHAQAIDLTEQRRVEQLLAHQATHDPATGLTTRAVFLDQLARALARLPRSGLSLAVMFCDLDRLKYVNDTSGHLAGDALIAEFAARVRATVRPSDVVSRIGGDEFAVLLEDVEHPAESGDIADRVLAALAQPFHYAGHRLEIRASIGCAVSNSSMTSPETLLAHADAAMYLAKQRGNGRYELFDDDAYAADVRSRRIERELRAAASSGQLVLHYQPLLHLGSGQITGVEALLRWPDGERGVVPASKFIDVAERCGLLRSLTAWLLNEACAQAADWDRELGAAAPRDMYVNIGASQLADDKLGAKIRAALAASGLAADRLKLEITETQILSDPRATAATVDELLTIGCAIVIDDFGTGYSSMKRLTELPVKELKIDRSFTSTLTTSRTAAAVAASIALMGHNLRYLVIAEGVESQSELAAVTELGCDLAQGYFIASPGPADEIAEALLRRPRP